MPTVTIARERDVDRAGTGADTLEPWNSASVGDFLIIETEIRTSGSSRGA
jgi:hypothetical protein